MSKQFHSVLLTPFDTLFFRDHRPFEAGVQKYSQTLFPTPMTFMGALSQAYFDKTGRDKNAFFDKKPDEQLGNYDETLSCEKGHSYAIRGVFILQDQAIFIPVPANFLAQKTYIYKIQQIFPDKKNQLQLPQNDFEYRQGYIRIEEFIDYVDEVELDEFQGPFQEEKRVGIGIDKQTNSTEEGALYFTTHQRFFQKNNIKSSFMVCYQTSDGNELNMVGALRLGGENRLVYTDNSKIKYNVDQTLNNFIKKTKEKLVKDWQGGTFRFLVYLLTPAIFKKGWQPQAWPWKDRAELIAACVPKPDWVSGFKIEKGRGGSPRPLYKAAPAGSVYFFETQDKALITELLDNYILGKSVSEIYPQAGFGMTLLNSWDYPINIREN